MAAPNAITKENVLPVIKVNSNTVALMPFGFIRNVASPEIIHNTDRQWFGETEKGMLQYAKFFQDEKISIMVKPHIWISHGEFTGHLAMKNEIEWQQLEKSYESFILTYAKAAQVLNAEILCIGTELEQFVVNRPYFWEQLIAKIRAVYKGKLTYAANWDEFSRVPFWHLLDYIGVDAYFPVSDKKTPTVTDYEIGWKEPKNSIMAVQKKYNKPILFTEFGYRSTDYAGLKPWDSSSGKNTVNLIAQTNGLQALYNQFWKEDWFAGGFIWKWFYEHTKVGGMENDRFTPQNKPAEKLIEKLYKQ